MSDTTFKNIVAGVGGVVGISIVSFLGYKLLATPAPKTEDQTYKPIVQDLGSENRLLFGGKGKKHKSKNRKTKRIHK